MKWPNNLTKQQLENLLSTLEYADKEAETFERRDTVRVQRQIEEIRQRLKELNDRGPMA
jgi:hypothetical protein